MALTLATVFAVNAVASLTAGTLIGAILDKEQRAYDFFPSPAGNYTSGSPAYTWPSSWNGVAITPGTTNATAIFPSVVSASVVTSSDGTNTGLGQVVLKLAPASGDVVLPASVMSYRLDPEAIVITVSGTFGAGGNGYGS